MRIVVLGAADSWYVRDLQRAATGRCELETAPFSQIEVEQTGCSPRARVMAGETRLDNCDAILVRTMPPGSLEQVVFRMDALATLEGMGVVVSNRPKAIEAAVDKYLSNVKLAEAGLRTPPTATCQSFESAMAAFDRYRRDIVVKPIFGGEGRGLMRLSDEGLAHRAFRTLTQLNAVLYIQPFIAHEFDIRLLRVGERVFAMRRVAKGDWRTNISQGGRGEPFPLDARLESLAIRAAEAVDAEIAGIDLIFDSVGEPIVLEVNAVPGWRALCRIVQEDIAAAILDHVRELANRTPAAHKQEMRFAAAGSDGKDEPG